MYFTYLCASKFAPESSNKSAGLSARSCVTSQVHEVFLWTVFLPQQGIVSMFFSGVGRQPISALPVLFLAIATCY
jgi:hypothetical protein